MAEDPKPIDLSSVRRLLWGGIAAFIALMLLRPLPSLYVDYLWFQEVGYDQLFRTRLLTQLQLGAVFGAFFLAVFLTNVLIALRRGPSNLVVMHEMKLVMPALEHLRSKFWIAALLVGVAMTIPAAQWGFANWLVWLRSLHAEPFGQIDPVFARDLSFYVFRLPFLQTAIGFLGFTFVMTILGTAVAYVVQGQIWARPGFVSVGHQAKRHVMLLVAVALVLLAGNDLLARFELLRDSRGIVAGAGYTTIHATMPGLLISAIASLVAAVVVIADSFRQSLRLTVATLVTLIIVHLGLVELWPAGMQKFFVAPSELERELPYIGREIAATRFAYALDDVQEGQFPATLTLSADAVAANAATVDNLRLWESGPLKTTNQQLQEIRTYYDFVDVDHDRYRIDGELRQVALSPRELNPNSLPSRTWINEHLTYTHGYGVAVATVNEISPEGLPVYLVKDIPPVSEVKELKVTRPEIYFGEVAADYVFVKTRSREFDYPSGDENVYTEYQGAGGIRLGGMLRRILFAIHFGEPKIVLSNDLLPDSRILIHRTVRDRIQRVAPYLLWEGDPYIIIREDGGLSWMLDGYTVTDRIPYSAPLSGVGNYIRNPVKAVLDAFNGNVEIYTVDSSDPLIRAYASIFPEAFKPLAEMPEDLKAHMRYPEGLFNVQAEMYGTYHMTDPQVFYNKEDLWKVANRSDGGQVSPYFTVTKLAGIGEKEEFILMLPFTPARKENMIAWMCARCDPPNYGRTLIFSFPKQRLIFGPQQIEARINQDTEISKELTLWNQQGSEVIRGNLLVVPIDSSLVYFQPIYLKASGERGLPELKRIVVAYGNRVAMEPTMDQALARVFGSGSVTRLRVDVASAGFEESAVAGGDGHELAAHLARAAVAYDRAQEALRRGDFQDYAREIDRLGSILGEATRQ